MIPGSSRDPDPSNPGFLTSIIPALDPGVIGETLWPRTLGC
jgi:hypothetical protein